MAAVDTVDSPPSSTSGETSQYKYQHNIADQTIVEVDEPSDSSEESVAEDEDEEEEAVDQSTVEDVVDGQQPSREPRVPENIVMRVKYRKLPPVYLDADKRQFANPISYLGGPRLDNRNSMGSRSSRGDSLTSLDSLMSLD